MFAQPSCTNMKRVYRHARVTHSSELLEKIFNICRVCDQHIQRIFPWLSAESRSRDRLGSKVTGLRIGWSRVQVTAGARFSSFPRRPDRLWGPSSLLLNGYPWLFLWVQSSRWIRLAIHLYLVPRLRMSGAISLLPLYSFMACIGTTFYQPRQWGATNQCFGDLRPAHYQDWCSW